MTIPFFIGAARLPSELQSIAEKVVAQKRLTTNEGLALLTTPHAEFVHQLADFDRKIRVGETVYYASTLHIYPTNLCELACPMCSFYAKPGDPKAWFSSPEELADRVEQALSKGISEIHIVSGLWKDCSLEYYKDLLQRIRRLSPTIHIKALTPVEYDFLAKNNGLTTKEVLEHMISWGLSSLPGGGAEILVEEVRQRIAPGKLSTKEFLDVHRTAHAMGLRSNMTMLFGTIENNEHIIQHLDLVRRLQDETGGIHTFVPLKYHQANNSLGKHPSLLKPKDIFRIYAVSRLMLDNIPHLKALWNYVGVEDAYNLLSCGANDFGSVVHHERVASMAGGSTLQLTEIDIIALIQKKNRIPKKIHSGHTPTINENR